MIDQCFDTKIYVVVAPSGVGKSSLIFALLQQYVNHIELAISHTTRSKRREEQHGVHYYFIDHNTFQKMKDAGEFLEWAQVHEHCYGTAHYEIKRVSDQGRKILLEIDIQGWLQVKSLYPHACSLFIMPPSIEEMQRRLIKRGSDSAQSLKKRWRSAAKELAYVKECDVMMINDCFDTSIQKLRSWICDDTWIGMNRQQGIDHAANLLVDLKNMQRVSYAVECKNDLL